MGGCLAFSHLVSLGEHGGIAPTHPARLLCLLWLNSRLPSRIFGRSRGHRPYPPCSPLNWLSPSCTPLVAKLASSLSRLSSSLSPLASCLSRLSRLSSSLSPLASSLFLILTLSSVCTAAIGGGQVNVGKVLIPMDVTQTDHLKAYGIAFWALQEGHPVEWLLNYRGGAFLMDFHETIVREARIRAVSFQAISAAQATRIYADIESANMNRMHLEKAPRIAVYTPPHKQPWGRRRDLGPSRTRKSPTPRCGTRKCYRANSRTTTGCTCTTKTSPGNTANSIAATAANSGIGGNRPSLRHSRTNWALPKFRNSRARLHGPFTTT